VKKHRRTMALIAGSASLALVLGACGSDDDAGSGDGVAPLSEGPGDEEVTITVATFNQFGYTEEMFQEYMDQYPNVTIVQSRAATDVEARENFFTKLGSSGLADVEAVEVSWWAEAMEFSDLLADLSDPEVEGRWLDWKTDVATDPEGRLVGYGTDIGPQGICYRSDLVEAAGLPGDREEFAALIDGDWNNYFEIGQQYTDATGDAWFDSAGATYQGLLEQIEEPYEDPETGEIIATENPEIKAAYDAVLGASATMSAHLTQWSDDWYAGQAKGTFATMLCPAWMLGVVEGAASAVEGWDLADVFPNGGANWGGSYLVVPTQGANQQAAKHVAAWLTAPEQQVQAFLNANTYPSQVDAIADEAVVSSQNEFFNNAPTGEIFASRAEAVTVTPYKGPDFFPVDQKMKDALTRVEDGIQNPDQSWDQFVKDVEALQ
jgi:cellobiose transport system substrate-binding protein